MKKSYIKIFIVTFILIIFIFAIFGNKKFMGNEGGFDGSRINKECFGFISKDHGEEFVFDEQTKVYCRGIIY